MILYKVIQPEEKPKRRVCNVLNKLLFKYIYLHYALVAVILNTLSASIMRSIRPLALSVCHLLCGS